jgi:hypothetical protein
MTQEECKSAMVDRMLEMQDAQMAVFDRLDIAWVTAGRDAPATLTRMIEVWLEQSRSAAPSASI